MHRFRCKGVVVHQLFPFHHPPDAHRSWQGCEQHTADSGGHQNLSAMEGS